ncbi:ketopantoate reductase-like protein [Rhodocollybia butyracea]|uniref:2-dehydropantoate 2-reductase n=1 Tax=Rhodocollybia butyracea TaxID=206335 RepID=A0A9P5Q5A3_9AGAR|nr:ketopantoate reductase-like protein [Rhodocollybia butyracea]
MRFHVVGLGAVGTLIAHHLRRTLPEGNSIALLFKSINAARAALWEDRVTVEENGLRIMARGFIYGTSKVHMVSAKAKEPDIMETSEIESLFVTLKAHQTVPAIRRLAPKLSPYSTIVLLQNGLGVYEQLIREIFIDPEQRPHFILASNTHGVYTRGHMDAVHAGRGEIRFGIVHDVRGRNYDAGFQETPKREPSLTDITPGTSDPLFIRYKSLRDTVASLLLMETLSPSWLPMEEMQIALRRKLVVNAAINPLTAILDCKNGDVFETPHSRSLLRRICIEAAQAFKAELRAGAEEFLENAGAGLDEDILLDRLPEGLTWQSLEKECLRVAKVTNWNISSMLADIRAGRSSGTEIDYINGYLMELGKAHKVYMPVNSTLAQLVRMKSNVTKGKAVL